MIVLIRSSATAKIAVTSFRRNQAAGALLPMPAAVSLCVLAERFALLGSIYLQGSTDLREMAALDAAQTT